MRKQLLILLVINFWGCGDLIDELVGPKVNLWGEDYSIKNTIEIDLSQRALTGSIPPRIGDLINLERLDLRRNQFTGSLPSEIGDLISLEILDLSGNQFTGIIPPEIGDLTNLKVLFLQGNQLTGSLPSELGNLTNLSRINLSYNQLSGFIPNEICDLNLKWYTDLSEHWSEWGTGLSRIGYNQFCPPYPACSINVSGQDTTNCE